MALSVGITDKASSTPGPALTALGKTTTAGSGVSVFVSTTGTTQPTISDTIGGAASGNTWTVVPTTGPVISTGNLLWHFKNEGGGARGADHRFQATGTDVTIMVVEVLGSGPVVDASNQASDASSPFGDAVSVTPSVPNYLLLSGLAANAGGTNTYTAGAGFTKILEEPDGNTWWPTAVGSLAVTGGAGAVAASWTDSAAPGNCAVILIAWRESGAVAAPMQAPLLTPLWMHPGRRAVWLRPTYLADVIVPTSVGALSGASATAAAGTAAPSTTVALAGQAATAAAGTLTVAAASVGNVNIDVNSAPAQGGGVLLTAFADGGSATLGGHGIQAVNGFASATTSSTTTSVSGSTFVIDVICQWDGGSLWTISDSKGNTYTQIAVVNNYSGNFDLVRLVKHNGTGGSGHTATATLTTGPTEITVFLTEITNCTALAGTSGATNSTVGAVDATNTVTSPNLNVTDTAAFLLGGFAGDGFSSNYVQTATGYTKIDEETSPGANTAQGATFYRRAVAGPGASLTGSSVTASAGTLIPNDTVAQSGIASTAAAGTATPTTAKSVGGQAATASAGTSVANLTVPLTGQAATTAQGTINAGQLLAGQAATFAQGTVNAGQTVAGSAATASAGTPGVSLVVPLTGASASTAQGSVSASGASGATLAGTAVTSSAGTVAPSITVALTGIALSAAQGTTAAALTRAISGSASSAVTGTLVPGVAVGVTGQQAAAVVGNISPAIAALLSHADIVVSQGTTQPASAGVVALTGQAMAASAGTLIALKAGPPGHGYSPKSSGEARPAGLGSVRPGGFTDRR